MLNFCDNITYQRSVMGLGYIKGGLVHDIVDIMSILWVVRHERHERNEKIRPIANGPKINDLAFIPNTQKQKPLKIISKLST